MTQCGYFLRAFAAAAAAAAAEGLVPSLGGNVFTASQTV
jgi:hypothetical protein